MTALLLPRVNVLNENTVRTEGIQLTLYLLLDIVVFI